MAIPAQRSANAAHVNMMTDTVIANLPADGLRVVMRAVLASHPEITGAFETETRRYLGHEASSLATNIQNFDMAGLKKTQRLIRCMLGSGIPFEGIDWLEKVTGRAAHLAIDNPGIDVDAVSGFLASVDGDVVQAMTAVQKALFVQSGTRPMSSRERRAVESLFEVLKSCQDLFHNIGVEYPYGRGLMATASILGVLPSVHLDDARKPAVEQALPPSKAGESFTLNGRQVPRIFSGLWQMSSPAWGSAPTSKIVEHFSSHAHNGFTAFDMADHYGDAEIIFGQFRSQYPFRENIFTATKYCVFHPYENPQYIDAIRYLLNDERVHAVGLCNFDTAHLQTVLDSGLRIHTNQVQFSLIDSRPTEKMSQVCEDQDVKLITYGTLCGGFLADKWLNKPEPDIYDESVTPSQRKVTSANIEAINELLGVLKAIGTKHGVKISNVATRWVLDFPYVGAVIVGARMGVSEHTTENMASFGWHLDQEDRQAIDEVLSRIELTFGIPAYSIDMQSSPPMSGANTIATATVLLETGVVPMIEPTTHMKLDGPAGLVRIDAECSGGKCTSVRFHNVPAFVFDLDLDVSVLGSGTIKVDIAWGGMIYVLVDASSVGLEIKSENGARLVHVGEQIKRAVQEQTNSIHPENPGIRGVTILEFTEPMTVDGQSKAAVNTVVVSPGRLHRVSSKWYYTQMTRFRRASEWETFGSYVEQRIVQPYYLNTRYWSSHHMHGYMMETMT
ncbi:MYB-like protein [Purpureocillium lavendulum]|uniref:MYB-like protein n=1 Tax=Purpureocillium lavendulum TaxID=1247861 RepID=A0AB34FG47_9HYPO|nr:MYB-like protein [Purpureocillium lavendulum]